MQNIIDTAQIMMENMDIDEELANHVQQGLLGAKDLIGVFSQYSMAKGLI